MKSFLKRAWAVLFIIAIWFIFSSPYFLKGLVPYASTYQVNFFSPWSHYEEFAGPVKNNAMPDIHTQIYPWKKFTIESFKDGEIPLWNPYNFAGNPHLANFQSAVLSPYNLLFFILPFIDAWSMLILLQPLLAGIFAYRFVREIGVSKIGSLVSSTVFMFCGFIVVWMAYGTLTYAILYLPLALFAIEKYVTTRKLLYLLLLTLTIPLSFFSGHFQVSLYFFVAVIAYALFKGLVTKFPITNFQLLIALVAGLLFSLPQLLPSIEFYQHAVRSQLFQVGETIPIQYFITIIAPDFFGNPVTRNDWFGHYAEWAGFIGIWPLILATLAIVKVRTKIVSFFAILGIVSLILAVRSPLSDLLIALKIPVLATSALSRIIVLFSFSFAVLAGIGLDQLFKGFKATGVDRKIASILLVVGLMVAIIWILLFFTTIYPNEWLIVAQRNFRLPTILLAAGAGIIMFARYMSIKREWVPSLIVLCVLFLTTFDSFRFAQKWMPFDPRNLVYPDVPVIAAIKENMGEGRVFGSFGEAVISSYYNIPLIDGYDPLYIGRYGEFIQSASNGKLTSAQRSVVRLDRRGQYTDRVIDLLGATLVFHPKADTYQGWAYPVWQDKQKYTLVYEDDKFELYKNNTSLPRALLFYNFEVISNDQKIIERFYNDSFDFKKTLILEEDPGTVLKEGSGSARLVSVRPHHITIKAQTTEPALVFLADNFYPRWRVRVNGVEKPIFRADYTFRAVLVDRGESTVEFIYDNWLL